MIRRLLIKDGRSTNTMRITASESGCCALKVDPCAYQANGVSPALGDIVYIDGFTGEEVTIPGTGAPVDAAGMQEYLSQVIKDAGYVFVEDEATRTMYKDGLVIEPADLGNMNIKVFGDFELVSINEIKVVKMCIRNTLYVCEFMVDDTIMANPVILDVDGSQVTLDLSGSTGAGQDEDIADTINASTLRTLIGDYKLKIFDDSTKAGFGSYRIRIASAMECGKICVNDVETLCVGTFVVYTAPVEEEPVQLDRVLEADTSIPEKDKDLKTSDSQDSQDSQDGQDGGDGAPGQVA